MVFLRQAWQAKLRRSTKQQAFTEQDYGKHARLSSDCWQTSESLPEHWHHFGHTTHSGRPSHLRLWVRHLRILLCKCSAVQHAISTNIQTQIW